MYSKVNQSNKYIVPEKECRITKYKQNGYEFIYFYKSKEEAEKYLNDNNEWNDKTYALNVIEDQKGTTQKIDAMLSSNLKTCPNVFDEDDDEDFILELLRKIKLANKFGEYLTLPFGSAEKDASEITLPNGSIITDVEVVVNKNSVSLKDVKAEHEWEIGFPDSVFCFGNSDENGLYPLQISCNAGDAEALRKYLGLKVSAINSMPVQPTGHYIVTDSDARIRDDKNLSKSTRNKIPYGTEVLIVDPTKTEIINGNEIVLVKVVNSDPEEVYYTAKSNLTEIDSYDNAGNTVTFRIAKNSVKLPYSSTTTGVTHEIDFECNIIAKCGIYYKIYSPELENLDKNEDNSVGYWIQGRFLSIREDKFLENVNWISQFDQSHFGDCVTGSCDCWPHKVLKTNPQTGNLEEKMTSNRCCCRACNLTISNAGFTTQGTSQQCIIADGNANCGNIMSTSTVNFEKALDLIETSLFIHEAPLVLGVHHPNPKTLKDECSGNSPSDVNHFIVLVGLYFDTNRNQYYLRFYEVGTKYQSNGVSIENRLYVDYVNHIIKGNTAYKAVPDYYTVITIRINKKQYLIRL